MTALKNRPQQKFVGCWSHLLSSHRKTVTLILERFGSLLEMHLGISMSSMSQKEKIVYIQKIII